MVPFWDSITEGYEGSTYSLEAWELCALNGFKVPGISTVKVDPRMKIDIPKETGRDGGPAIEKGHEPAKVDIQVKIWTPPQWEELQRLRAALWRAPGQKKRWALGPRGTQVEDKTASITIAHPATIDAKVAAVLIESWASPEPAAEVGARIVRIRAVQYIPPSKTKATKKASGAGPPIDPAFTRARNNRPLPPSKTDAVPRRAPAPNQGGI